MMFGFGVWGGGIIFNIYCLVYLFREEGKSVKSPLFTQFWLLSDVGGKGRIDSKYLNTLTYISLFDPLLKFGISMDS